MPAPATPGAALAQRLIQAATSARERVFPLKPTRNTKGHYIVYRKTAGGGGKRLNGRNRLQSYLFRIDCYAGSQDEADALLKAVLATLAAWDDHENGVHGCFEAEDQDDDLVEDGGGDEYYVAGQTVELWFMG